MPNGKPTNPQGQVSSRERIENKILLIAGKIERGRRAADRKEITFYNWSTLSSAVLSALTGMGISHPFITVLKGETAGQMSLSQITEGLEGWMLTVGVICMFVLLVIQYLYRQKSVEKIAVEALAAQEAFQRLEENLRDALQDEDPMQQLITLQAQAQALTTNYFRVLPRPDQLSDQRAAELKNRLVQAYSNQWVLPELGVVGGVRP